MRPVFIVGCHRSGTTLMRRILNSHPEIFLSKETGFLPYLLQIGQQCDAQVVVELINSYLTVEKWNVLLERDYLSTPSGEGVDIAELYRYVCLLESKQGVDYRYWGDNTPQYVCIAPLLFQMFPDARFIHMVRDPRDVVASIIDLPFRGNTPYLAAVEWMSRIGDWLIAERVIPAEQRFEVRYEDLVQNPDSEVVKILDFLDLDSANLAGWKNGVCDEVAQLPHHKRLNAPIDSSSVGRFTKKLDKSAVAQVESVVRQAMIAYGYQPISPYRPSPALSDDWRLACIEHSKDMAIRIIRKILKMFNQQFRSQGR